jgi:rRNA maturation protein Nop10
LRAWIYCRDCGNGFDGEATPEGYVLGDDVCPACGNKLRATSPAFAIRDDDRFVLTDQGYAAIGKIPVTP